MTENNEDELPFKFGFSKEFDGGDMTLEITVVETVEEPDRAKLQDILTEWAEKGVADGYDGTMSSWEFNEKPWNKKRDKLAFWVDLGRADPEKAFDVLFDKLAMFGKVKKIFIK